MMPSFSRDSSEIVPILLQVLRAHANHSHRRADLVRESRRQGADGGEPIRALQLALEFQLAPMPSRDIGARRVQLLIEPAEFLAQ